MSLLYRKLTGTGRRRAAGVAIAGSALWATAPVSAVDFYYQPIVQLSTAYNTNLDLAVDPADKRGAEGYYADAATNIGIATPTSETILQPRILYNYYPSASDRDRLEAFLNLNSRYSWQRDRFNITGSFDHRDDVNAEQPSAADTNTVNPGTGITNPTTGRSLVGVTRNYLVLDPTFTHSLSPLSGIGLAAEYQRLSYSVDDSNHVAYGFYQGRLFYSKTIDQRTDFAIGAYGNRYDAQNVDSTTNSAGVQANGGFNWTQTLRSTLNLQFQDTRFHMQSDTRDVRVTSHPWAANLNTVYDALASKYTFTLGRAIYPSSAGGMYTTDQVRAQYDRDYTQRLHFTGAIRAFRDRSTSGLVDNNYRNYVTGMVRAQYFLTQRLFVATTYTYVYQKYRFDPESADANVINVSFGYRGLERQH